MPGLRDEFAAQLRLATPVIVVNLAMMGMGIVDAAMMGHDSTRGLAAVSLGHAYFWIPVSFGIGVLLALDPLVSQARGARDEPALARSLQRGVFMALLLSVPLCLVLLAAGPVLRMADQPAAVVPEATDYVLVSALGVPGLLVWFGLRQGLQALGSLRPIVIVALAANVLNGLLDWMFIQGGFGLPRMGAVGCAIATVICDYLMVGMLIVLTWPVIGGYLWPLAERVTRKAPLWRMFALGAPIGVTLVLEAGAFNVVTMFMGWFGETEMAGHRTALILAAASFMVPLGLSTAAAVRVGHAVGAGDREGMQRAARVSLLSAAAVMVVFAGLFLWAPTPLARLFTTDPAVVALAASLLPLAAAFQLFDGLQVVAAGVLRGVGETRWPMAVNMLGYWVLGLPLGVLWAFRGDGGPRALWWALGAALAFVAAVLLIRVRIRLGRVVRRIDLEGPAPPGVPEPAGAIPGADGNMCQETPGRPR